MQHDNESLQTRLKAESLWIIGTTRSGKTSRLIEQFRQWAETELDSWQIQPVCLVFAAIGDNRLNLVDRITTATQGRYAFDSATPVSFFENEVLLFWPLLAQQLNLKAQFPLRLRPETEQELATKLWQPQLSSGQFRQAGVSDYFLVRRTLDLLQLAAAGGTPHEQIPLVLPGLSEQTGTPQLWEQMGRLLAQWRQWCLDRGLLTYGILTELYWRYLLPHPIYQQHLKRRYRAVLVDDVDEYPAVSRTLFEFFFDQEVPIAFTFNPEGGIRVGLGADPDYLARLADSCQIETLPPNLNTLGASWGLPIIDCIREPLLLPQIPDPVQVIQTVSKAQLLRQTAETIVGAIESGEVLPEEIAILSPGLDAITRYTLQEILESKNISLLALNSQQPLMSSALVRALLSLLACVYPDLGRLLNRESIAEMLVVLSQGDHWDFSLDQSPTDAADASERPVTLGAQSIGFQSTGSQSTGSRSTASLKPKIDPVRAGLLTDHCFIPDPVQPRLLPPQAFARWDRLGYAALQTYSEILQWLASQQEQQRQHLLSSPVVLLDRAIQQFFGGGSQLPYNQLSVLRELMETAQHYWDIENRLRQFDRSDTAVSEAVGRFIQLLRAGTITADPFPVRPIGSAQRAVTLATVYQYRSDRRHHRWQFWLDAGSALWLTGASGLFGAPLFWRDRANRPWTEADALAANQIYLERELLDLLNRTSERVYLCHCELGINGQEQAGVLMPIVNAAVPINTDTATHAATQNLNALS